MDEGYIFYVGPMYHDILRRNGGNFPDSTDDEIIDSFCCWYIARCCHLAILEIPAQVTLEGDTDITVNLRNIMAGCIKAYGLDSDDGEIRNRIMNLMPLARLRAFTQGMTWSDRFQAWLDSGGHSYNVVTREPDAI